MRRAAGFAPERRSGKARRRKRHGMREGGGKKVLRVVMADPLAGVLPAMFGRLVDGRWRTPAQTPA